MAAFTIRKDGVKHDEAHSLRTNQMATPGEKVARLWICTCGREFGKLYDNQAVTSYRTHRKEVGA